MGCDLEPDELQSLQMISLEIPFEFRTTRYPSSASMMTELILMGAQMAG